MYRLRRDKEHPPDLFSSYSVEKYAPVKKFAPVIDFPAVVKFLLESNCDVNFTNIPEKRTALHVAASGGSVGVLNVLLNSGAGIELKDYRGDTPLILAARHDNFECVVELLKCGADTYVRNTDLPPCNALMEARRYKEFSDFVSFYGQPRSPPREFQNETRSSILLAMVEEDLEDLRTDRSETFVSAMQKFPLMEPEIISKMLENTHNSVHISTKNIDIDGIVHLVNEVWDKIGHRI